MPNISKLVHFTHTLADRSAEAILPSFRQPIEIIHKDGVHDFDPVTLADRVRLQRIFRDVLRYEFLFWEMAYKDERWPDG